MSKFIPTTLINARPADRPHRRILPLRRLLALAAILAFTHVAGAASYTWNTLSGNWSSPSSWSSAANPSGPLGIDSVIFNNTFTTNSPTTPNNIVDAGFAGTVTNFTVNSFALGTYVYDVTQIPFGQTLTVASNMFIGGVNESNATATFACMVGAGTLNVTGPSLIVQNYSAAAGANCAAYLNLSGLTNFVYHNTNGSISMASFVPPNYTSGNQGTRQAGSIILAAVTNLITASSLNFGSSGVAQAGPIGQVASGIANQLTFGPGTNILNISTFNIAAQKNPFTVSNSGGGLRIRGITGADSDSAVNITIGNKNVSGGTGNTTGSLLLNGCNVNIKAGTLIVGENINATPSSAGSDAGIGVLAFDTGTISANTVIMADDTSANQSTANQAQCSGTIDVGANATLLIGAGQVFDLASETSTGPSTGTLIISNGLVNCQGPLAMGPNVGGTSSGNIVFLSGGTLNMGPNSYVGIITNPVTSLTLATNCTLSVSIPSVSYTNICVKNVNWPSPDTGMTIAVAAMPAGINPGVVFPLLNFSGTFTGTYINPNLSLPPGVLGNLSLAPGGNTMYLTITAGVGPGTGGVNELANSSFEQSPAGSGWAATGGASVVTTNVSTTYPNTGSCTVDTRPVQVLNGTNTAKLTGSFVAGGSTNSWSQSVALAPGTAVTAGGFTYVAHEDMLSGADSFYYELDFKGTNGALLASYESTIITNMTCGGPNIIPLDSWALMALTNTMQITAGLNTGVVIGNVAGGVITVPPQTATTQFKAVFVQRNATDAGSVYFDGANLGFLAPPVPPTVLSATPNLTTFCTNTTLSCTVTSTVTSISSVQLIIQSTTLGGLTTNTVTNVLSAPYVTGLGTSSAAVNFPLATNVIYPFFIIQATDADGITALVTNTFDTLVPTLVVEAADFNYNSGLYMTTPANGGFALYQGLVGTPGIDEYKQTRASTESYYRPGEAVIVGVANPGAGTPPSSTEQKFVTALAGGDTNDIEVEVGFNTPGDWVNYSRVFGPGGSAPAGTYNVWCYLATSGTGVEESFSQVTSDPTQPNQTTNFLGNFGSAAFSDTGYNNYRYVPLVDQFGNRVALTLTNGVQTFKATVVGNPNLGFYLFVPVAPVYTPVLQNVTPNGSQPFQSPGGQFSFTVGPAQGTPISTNGIGLTLNGVPITSGLTFTPVGSSWTVHYTAPSNNVYNVVINVTNGAGLSASYASTFDTFSLSNYTWEAVDYDFSTNDGSGNWLGGQFIDNPVPTCDVTAAQTGTFATNSYYAYPTGLTPGVDGYGAIAQQGIDIGWPNLQTAAAEWYRADGVGSEVTTDFVRPKFVVAQQTDPSVGEIDLGYFNTGNWVNYTRHYPTNFYNVWGRLAGGAGAFSGTKLSMITSGVGTLNQTTNLLGTFADLNASGWQAWHWIPLLDTNNNPVVVQLGGLATLRLTSGNNLNAEFLMLTPASAAASTFSISAALSGTNVLISIPTQAGHNYTVYYAGSLPAGSWTPVGSVVTGDGTVHVVSQPATGAQGYYRVIAQ